MNRIKVFETHYNYPSNKLDHIFIGLFDYEVDRWDGMFSIEKDGDGDLIITIPDDSWHILSQFNYLFDEISKVKEAGADCGWYEIIYLLGGLGFVEL